MDDAANFLAMVNRQTAVVVPRVSPDVFPWDKHPAPGHLYKYCPPERFQVLTQCRIRFSQRQVFEDSFELRPEVKKFGNEDEIRKFMEIDPVLSKRPSWLREAVVRLLLDNPEREAALVDETQGWLKARDEFGVLCFTENPVSDRMWEQYADRGRGFVVEFDTTYPTFELLRSPGRLGKVEYSDEPFPSFLSTYGVNTFFRKRTQYNFEVEWRSIRRLSRFSADKTIRVKNGVPIYLGRFDPACISAILIRPECAIEWELRTLVAVDCRYRHVPVRFA